MKAIASASGATGEISPANGYLLSEADEQFDLNRAAPMTFFSHRHLMKEGVLDMSTAVFYDDEHLSDRLACASTSIRAYEQERAFTLGLLKTPILTSDQKVLLLLLRDLMQQWQVRRMRLENALLPLEQATQLKRTKIINCCRELAEQGILTWEIVHERSVYGKRQVHTYVSFPAGESNDVQEVRCPCCKQRTFSLSYVCLACHYVYRQTP